jgi:hypothetical protein
MKRWVVFVTVVAATLCSAPQLWAKTFYLKNGEEITYRRYWQEKGRVYVQINRDTLVDFAPDEVDLAKTAKAAKTGEAKKKARHATPAKRKHPKAVPAPGASTVQESKPAPVANPALAPQPVPAVSAKPAPAPAKPVPAAAALSHAPPKPQTAAVNPPVQGAATSAKQSAGAAMVKPGPPPRTMLPLKTAPPVEPPRAVVLHGILANGAYLLVLTLIMVVSMCRVFAKAGEAWWKALIPVYGLFVFVAIAGKPWWWALLMLVPLVNIFIYFVVHIALARRFGEGTMFGFGLALVGIVFFPLLAFGKYEYR